MHSNLVKPIPILTEVVRLLSIFCFQRLHVKKFKLLNVFKPFMVRGRCSNCIGVVVSNFFKQTEKNSKQDKVEIIRVRLLELN